MSKSARACGPARRAEGAAPAGPAGQTRAGGGLAGARLAAAVRWLGAVWLGAVATARAACIVGDEALRVTLDDEARIVSLQVGGAEVLSGGRTGGLAVADLAAGGAPVELRGTARAAGAGAELSLASGALGLRAACRMTPGARHSILLQITVDDRTGRERGVSLEVGFPVGAEGWTWWDGPDTPRPVTASERFGVLTRLRGLPGLPEFDGAPNLAAVGSHSLYPLAAVTGKAGLALAKPPRAAGLFRLGLDGPRGVLHASFDAALSPDARTPGRAEFSLALLPLDPRQGFRGALAEVYALWPEDFASRVPSYGGWMPFQRLSAVSNVDEFGFAYQEGAPEPAFDDALGVSSFTYFHCAGEFVTIPGYTRDRPLPPYEELLAAVNAAIKQRTGLDDLWTVTGIRTPDGRVDIRPENTYGHLFAQPCVSPELPYGRLMAERLVSRVTRDPFPEGIDGCYYDGLAAGLDYGREHFRVARHSLLWDPERGRDVAYNFFASLEWAERVADAIRPQGKLTMLNDSSLNSFPFVFPYIDVLGAEGPLVNPDETFLRVRAYARRKPFCTLLKADYRRVTPAQIESYMRQCLAFGHLFGFFDISPSGANPGSSYWEHPEWYDRDRDLFRRYMPVAVGLCRAGWEPVQLAECSVPGVRVERFGGGPRGGADALVFFTVRRAPDGGAEGDSVPVRIPPAVSCARAPDAWAVDLLTGGAAPVRDGLIAARVPAGEMTVVAVGARAAHVRRFLECAAHLAGSRRRYLQARRTQERGLAPWAAYGSGAEIVPGGPGGSQACLHAALRDPAGSAGALQTITLNQKTPAAILVRASSRAAGVSGAPDAGYSLYVDCYCQDGKKIYGQTIRFDTGTHDWQSGEIRVVPESAIASVNVYCLFRGHTGEVWFDDVWLASETDSATNLLQRGTFESDAAPAPPPAVGEADRRLVALGDALEALLAPGRAEAPDEAAIAALAQSAADHLAWARQQPRHPDLERLARDFRDACDLLQEARAAAAGIETPPLRPQRLTPPAPLAQRPAPRRPIAPARTAVAAAEARMPRGTRVTVDSCYEGYRADPLADGKINPPDQDWSAVAWASAEEDGEHWVRLEFPAPQTVTRLVIHWALDNGAWYPSRRFVVETLRDGAWTPIPDAAADAAPNGSSTAVSWPPARLTSLRLRQPAGGGSPTRPDLLWISELEVY